MILKLDRGVAYGCAASLLVVLTGCTGIDDSVKADLAAKPISNPNSLEMQAANAAEAATSGAATTAKAVAVADTQPAPIIPGTDTAAPVPMLKESALAATPQTPASQALDMVASTPTTDQQQIAAAAAPVQATVAPAAQPQTASATAAAPTVLAYAAPLRVTALTSFGDPFDTSAPSTEDKLEPQSKADTIGPTRLNALIKKYSKVYEVPEELVHRVVKRESRYNPSAYSKGNYGLMQIRYNTAKAMGYNGSADGLFDAETNIKYAVKYLKGAWLVADTDHDQAVRLYSRGYYYDAKKKGMLHLTQ
ncbi:lytic transglycosylase domain-containing protein [Rhizobium sp. AAP43]|uniref:lytic transglycosylase domain-containing protein n=1 Tax=Rhizobium sp. AAP43 TaxID=1523420 RepID=UPI0006B89165|nr:lytic transglycosylase domain-containing protein [Rhizobium sp. AAP43]KPF42437.1 lytic transglycosylase [Rhizobium sp. AAP43]